MEQYKEPSHQLPTPRQQSWSHQGSPSRGNGLGLFDEPAPEHTAPVPDQYYPQKSPGAAFSRSPSRQHVAVEGWRSTLRILSPVVLSQGSAALPRDDNPLTMDHQRPLTVEDPYRTSQGNAYQKSTVSTRGTIRSDPHVGFPHPTPRRSPASQGENRPGQDFRRAIPSGSDILNADPDGASSRNSPRPHQATATTAPYHRSSWFRTSFIGTYQKHFQLLWQLRSQGHMNMKGQPRHLVRSRIAMRKM